MALPTFVAAGASAAGVGAIAPGLPAGHTLNDILVLAVETNSSQPATAPTGWTEFPDSPQDCTGAGSVCLAAFWKRHDGTEADPTVADTGNHQIAAIIAVRGCVATGDPFDVTAGNVLNLGATSTTITIPGDTTTVADCFIVAIGAHDIDATGEQIANWANADLANVLQRVDVSTDAGGGGGFGIATGEKATAGLFGSTTATIGSATEQGRIMVALKPPADEGDDATVLAPSGIVNLLAETPAISYTGTVTLPASGIIAIGAVAPTFSYSGSVAAPTGTINLFADSPTITGASSEPNRFVSAVGAAYALRKLMRGQ